MNSYIYSTIIYWFQAREEILECMTWPASNPVNFQIPPKPGFGQMYYAFSGVRGLKLSAATCRELANVYMAWHAVS